MTKYYLTCTAVGHYDSFSYSSQIKNNVCIFKSVKIIVYIYTIK